MGPDDELKRENKFLTGFTCHTFPQAYQRVNYNPIKHCRQVTLARLDYPVYFNGDVKHAS